MWTVKEVSRITGVSVRALHHYDAIGLLKPAKLTNAGYRLYDDAALSRLQQILLFRELRFSLREIKAILDSPDYDPAAALTQQIALLEMQRQRLDEIISLARTLQTQGGMNMEFRPFDDSAIQQLKEEARAKWGGTAAYQEYQEKAAAGADFDQAARQMTELFAGFGRLRHLPPDAQPVQQQVCALQEHITRCYYTCTREILYSLGQMYTEDQRFAASIDQAGGEGTAAFVRQAIEAWYAHT